MMTPHKKVFISYAKEDVVSARKLYKDLRTEDYIQAWFDEESLLPGHNWKKEIKHKIKGSDYFIILISKHSMNKRGVVQKEIREAIDVMQELPDGKIYIIPARLDESHPTHDFLADIQWIDLFRDWNDGIKKIKGTILFSTINEKLIDDGYVTLQLSSLIKKVIKIVKPTAKKDGIKIVFKEFNNKLIILGNEEKITRTLLILLSNALYFSEKGTSQANSEITISLYNNGSKGFIRIDNIGN